LKEDLSLLQQIEEQSEASQLISVLVVLVLFCSAISQGYSTVVHSIHWYNIESALEKLYVLAFTLFCQK
jgi:hypothetical protein